MKKVQDIMTDDVLTVDPNATLRDALEAFLGAGVSGAPVVRTGEVVGVLSVSDIMQFHADDPGVPAAGAEVDEVGEFEAAPIWDEGSDTPSAYFVDFWTDAGADLATRFEQTDSPEWDVLEAHVVSEVMSTSVVGTGPDASVREAAGTMVQAGVHRILVMDGGKLLGIMTATDVLRAVAEGDL